MTTRDGRRYAYTKGDKTLYCTTSTGNEFRTFKRRLKEIGFPKQQAPSSLKIVQCFKIGNIQRDST